MSAAHYGTTACLRSFAQVRKSLPLASQSISGQIQVVPLEDEFGRFRVWAANIGALQKGHSSLDYRLREAPLVRDNVQKLLKELHECLQEINVILTGTRLPYDRQRRPIAVEDDESDSSDDDSSSQVSLVSEVPMTELRQRFLTVVDVVDNLYKFSRMIRTPALHTRFLKAASYKKIDRDTGIDLIGQFKAADFAYVKEGFLSFRRENGNVNPSLSLEDSHLIRRFAGAITKRRQQFLYWKRHRDKLGVHARTEDFEVSTVIAPETVAPTGDDRHDNQTAPDLPARALLDEKLTIDVPPQSPISKTELTDTTATMFIPTDIVSEAGVTTTSFATTARGLDGSKVELPALPKSAAQGKDFECQYCFAIVPSRYQSSRGWRAHVLRDLKPYICTYPGCSQSDLLFSSRRKWLDHEQWEHRKRFTCPEHPQQSFITVQEFQMHMQEYPHKVSSELSFDALEDISRNSDLDSRRICPICVTLFPSAERLHNHLANHLERFAAFALPRDVETIDDDEFFRGSGNSSGDSHNPTDGNLEPELRSVAEKVLILHDIFGPVRSLQNNLDDVMNSRTTPTKTKELIADLKDGSIAPLLSTLNALKGFTAQDMESTDLLSELNEAVGSVTRLQNLLDSVRIEDSTTLDSQIKGEMVQHEHEILSRLLTSLRGKRKFELVQALYDYEPEETSELALRKGDIIRVIESVYKDWWKGSLYGKIGMFPVNYVEKVSAPTAEDLEQEAKRTALVYSYFKDAEKLLTLTAIPETANAATDPKLWKEHLAEANKLYDRVNPVRPAITQLVTEWSQRKNNLVALNEKFIRARRLYEDLLESQIYGIAPPRPPYASANPDSGSGVFNLGDYGPR